MNGEKYIKTGKLTALVSFLIGTAIFGLYYLTSSAELLFIGYGFILLTGLINIIILTLVLSAAFKDNKNRKNLLLTSGLMLLNIPVMLVYVFITFILLDTMRITFTNATQATLTDINIVGCGGGHIDKLEIGESKTIWVDIIGDCSIDINYLSDGKQKEESVATYVTNSMGQKMEHNIGELNDNKF